MTKVDGNYWMKGVEFGEVRGRLIQEFFDLMDKDYQEREWINIPETDGFDHYFSFAVELFDDLMLYDCLEEQRKPDILIGKCLKDQKEIDKLMNVAYLTDKLIEEDNYTNEEYLSSEYLEPMRKAAKEAFDVFMENEKDNKEFCDWIAELQAKRARGERESE
jgi:hypothetical protein